MSPLSNADEFTDVPTVNTVLSVDEEYAERVSANEPYTQEMRILAITHTTVIEYKQTEYYLGNTQRL